MNLVQYIFDRKTKNSTTKYPGSLLASYPGGHSLQWATWGGSARKSAFFKLAVPGGGGTWGKFGWGCAAEAFKPWPCLRQNPFISLPCLRQETSIFCLCSAFFCLPCFSFPIQKVFLFYINDIIELDFKIMLVPTCRVQGFQSRKTPCSRR